MNYEFMNRTDFMPISLGIHDNLYSIPIISFKLGIITTIFLVDDFTRLWGDNDSMVFPYVLAIVFLKHHSI